MSDLTLTKFNNTSCSQTHQSTYSNYICNFFLSSRLDATSSIEKTADFLLTPARVLFGGKKVVVFFDSSAHVVDQGFHFGSQEPWTQTAVKITIALAAFPAVFLGAPIKLLCLNDKDYRSFCEKQIPIVSNCHPKLFEMFQHVHSTADFASHPIVDPEDFWVDDSKLVFKPLDLYECSCEGTHAFHRLDNPRRNNFEKAIVDRLATIHPDKKAPIKLISMGSGGLMSDFIILEKLFLSGFENITLDCIEPKGIDPSKIESIKKFFKEYPNVSLNISAYDYVDDLPSEESGYSAVIAVDYDILAGSFSMDHLIGLADLMYTRSRLTENGVLALGFSDEDVLFSKSMNPITILNSSTSLLNIFAEDLINHLKNQTDLSIIIPDLDFESFLLLMYGLAIAAEKAPESYRKISIFYRDSSILNSIFENRRQKMLDDAQFALDSLFPNADVEISAYQNGQKCDILLTGSLEDEFKSKEYLNFLNQMTLTYVIFPEGIIYRQIGDQESSLVQIK